MNEVIVGLIGLFKQEIQSGIITAASSYIVMGLVFSWGMGSLAPHVFLIAPPPAAH